MGYTTDANYLIQAGRDIWSATAMADQITSTFGHDTHLADHEWGTVYGAMAAEYDKTRDAMRDCMTEVVDLLRAYAEALQHTGEEYLRIEEQTRQLLEGLR